MLNACLIILLLTHHQKLYYFTLCIFTRISIKLVRSKAPGFCLFLESWDEAGRANKGQTSFTDTVPSCGLLFSSQSRVFRRVSSSTAIFEWSHVGHFLQAGSAWGTCPQIPAVQWCYNLILFSSHSETVSQSHSVHEVLHRLVDSSPL